MNCAADERGVLVIGCGNPLREDDGLGYIAAAALEADCPPGVRVIYCHQLLPELAVDISRARLVILIDARADAPPGQIDQVQVTPQPPVSGVGHHIDMANILYWGQALYRVAPRCWAFSVGAASFGYREELSAPVAAALPELLAAVRRFLAAQSAKIPESAA